MIYRQGVNENEYKRNDVCVNYQHGNQCDGQEPICLANSKDKTQQAKGLLCCLSLKLELEHLLCLIKNIQTSIRSDLDKKVTNPMDSPVKTNQITPSDATCCLLKELLCSIEKSQFIKYIPDLDCCPVWYYIFLDPVSCPIQGDLPCNDLIRRKIVARDEKGKEYSIFQLCKIKEYISYSVCNSNTDFQGECTDIITYQEALGELEKLLILTQEANNLVCKIGPSH